MLELVDPGKYPEISAGAAYLLAGLRPEDIARSSNTDSSSSSGNNNGNGNSAFNYRGGGNNNNAGASPGGKRDGSSAASNGGGGSSSSSSNGDESRGVPHIDPRLLPGMIHRHALPADEKMATELALHQLAQGLSWVARASAGAAEQGVHEQQWQHRQLVLASLDRASTLYYRRGSFSLQQREPGPCLQNVMLALQCRAGTRVMEGAAATAAAAAATAAAEAEVATASTGSAFAYAATVPSGVGKLSTAVASRDLVAAAMPSVTFKPEKEDDLLAAILEMAGDVLSQLKGFCGTDSDALDEAHTGMWQRTRTDAVFMSLVQFLSARTAKVAPGHTFDPDAWFENWEAEVAAEDAAGDGRSSSTSTCSASSLPSSPPLTLPLPPSPPLSKAGRRENGVLPTMATSGEVWEGLELPLDIRAAESTIFAAAAHVYEKAERHHLATAVPSPSHGSSRGMRSGTNYATAPPTLLLQKLGNARNMFGSLLLDATAAVDTSLGGTSVETANTLWQRSFSVLSQSLSSFESAGDLINTALVSCNLGKLMRVGYRAALMQGRVDALPSDREKQLHDKAIQFYQHAAGALGRREVHPDVWDRVNLELAGAYLAFAVLHESIPYDQSQRHFVLELLQKALR